MKLLSVFFLVVAATLAGCSTTANNATPPANMRGANTNTGYVTNTNTNVAPAMPANVVNISPPSMNSGTANSNSNRNAGVNTNSNTRKP